MQRHRRQRLQATMARFRLKDLIGQTANPGPLQNAGAFVMPNTALLFRSPDERWSPPHTQPSFHSAYQAAETRAWSRAGGRGRSPATKPLGAVLAPACLTMSQIEKPPRLATGRSFYPAMPCAPEIRQQRWRNLRSELPRSSSEPGKRSGRGRPGNSDDGLPGNRDNRC